MFLQTFKEKKVNISRRKPLVKFSRRSYRISSFAKTGTSKTFEKKPLKNKSLTKERNK